MMQPAITENVTSNHPQPTRARRRSVETALLLLLFAILLAPPAVPAQGEEGGDAAPQSETLKRLNELKAEAQAREAIAKAKRAEMDARFPQSDIKTLEGKTTLEGEKRVEEQLAGHISVARAANNIAAAIHDKHKGKAAIVIYNDGDIQLLIVYSAATKRVDAYTSRYTTLTAAEQAALAANPMWAVPTAPCDDRALASPGAGMGGAAFINPLGVATSVLGSFGEILSFFRTDVTIKSSVFEVGEPVIVTEVFRALRKQYTEPGDQVALYYAREIPPDFDPTRDSPMLLKLEALFNAKSNADTLAAQIAARVNDKTEQRKTLVLCQRFGGEGQATMQALIAAQQKVVDDLQAEIVKQPRGKATGEQAAKLADEQQKLDELKSRLEPMIAAIEANKRLHGSDIARLDREIAALQTASAPLAALNAQADLLAKDMMKVDDKTGLNPLTAFIRAEMIQKFMQDNNAYWLKLRVVTAGGNTKVKTNLFADVFNGGNRVFYSGASIVEYHLYDRFGRSLLSDTTNNYEDYKKAKDVKKLADNRAEVDQ